MAYLLSLKGYAICKLNKQQKDSISKRLFFSPELEFYFYKKLENSAILNKQILEDSLFLSL